MFSRLRKLNIFSAATPKRSESRRVGREHFIPVCPAELIDELAASLHCETERANFLETCRQMKQVFHAEALVRLDRLYIAYTAVNPDRETLQLRANPTCVDQACEVVYSEMVELLERANFRRLSSAEIADAIGTASDLGVRLHIDLDSFEHLAVFVRGNAEVSYTKLTWNKWWLRTELKHIPLHQRLVVVFRMKDEEEGSSVKAAYIRLFKNVPHQDIDMLLPGGEIRMSLLDRGKILLPTISGLGLLTFKAGMLVFAGIYGLIKIAGLVGGAVGSGWKSISGYWKTKNRYELSLTRNLYYQNLDNNVGVLLRVAKEAEAQELREAALAHFVLRQAESSMAIAEVEAEAERLLNAHGIEVDFEVEDAIAKLHRLGLCQEDSGRWLSTPHRDLRGHCSLTF